MREELIKELFDIGAVKFGEFTFKSGITSPIYIDLRGLFSFPKTAKKVIHMISEELDSLGFDLIAGIPYTALPIASSVAIEKDIPMIFARKERKNYGTKKIIEGTYKKGDVCVIIDDIITNGDSKIETAIPFEEEGIKINDFVILVDREQGGKEVLAEKGYRLHSVFRITEILDTLLENNKISQADYKKSKNSLAIT